MACKDMVGLAQTHMGPDVKAYLSAKHKGILLDDLEEVEQALLTCYMLFDNKVRVELQFDGLRQRSTFQAYMDKFQRVDAALSFAGSPLLTRGSC